MQYRRDLFDNVLSRVATIPSTKPELFFDFALEIDLHEQNPFDFLLDYDAANYPFKYTAADSARARALPDVFRRGALWHRSPPRLLPLPFWSVPADADADGSVAASAI